MDVYTAAQRFFLGVSQAASDHTALARVHAYIHLECILKKKRTRSLTASHITLETPMVNSVTEGSGGHCVAVVNHQ